DALIDSIEGITAREFAIPFYSTVTGERIESSDLNADYWYRNARQTVLFADAVKQLLSDHHAFFVEISPHPVLTLALQENVGAAWGAVAGTLRRNRGDLERLLLSWGELQTRGVPVELSRAVPSGARVALPTYAFQRERYWLDRRWARTDLAAVGQVEVE